RHRGGEIQRVRRPHEEGDVVLENRLAALENALTAVGEEAGAMLLTATPVEVRPALVVEIHDDAAAVLVVIRKCGPDGKIEPAAQKGQRTDVDPEETSRSAQ